LDIYKASAGSGKTHLLTVKYLSLLFADPQAYRQILAVTFTNKATAEMKERILKELGSLARKELTTMGRQLLELGVVTDEASMYEQAQKIYGQLLHDYSRFSVSTIDAFTQKMIRSCSWELGIDAAFNIQLETDVVCNDLADRLFEKVDTKGYETLRRQMVELAEERLLKGKSWDFKDEMVKMAKMIFTEAYLNFESVLTREKVDTAQATRDLATAVATAMERIEQEWKALALKGKAVMEAFGTVPDDFSNKTAGFGGRFDRLLIEYADPLGNKNVEKVYDGKASPYAKATPLHIKARVDNAMPALMNAMREMVDYFRVSNPVYQTAIAIRANLGYLRLVLLMGRELAAWRQENNALLISDTHNLLRQLSAETTPEFIYEKTGNRLKHFLMDEFQDTSDFQYHNFRPMLQNSMAQGAYNLVVGDVKQAIYRWRNGDWLLLHQRLPADLAAFRPVHHTLEQNYRSARPIIRFNNFLFGLLPGLLQQKINSELQKAPEALRQSLLSQYETLLTDAYADVRQTEPGNSPAEGMVNIRFVDKYEEQPDDEEDDDFNTMILREVHTTIGQLLQEGYRPGDIAILCRSNEQAKLTIEMLMLWQQGSEAIPYPLISAEALQLGSNGAVQQVIAAMQWLLNEGDRSSLTILRQTYARRQGVDTSNAALYMKPETPEQGLPPGLFAQRARLRSLPVPDLINELIGILGLKEREEDIPYVLTLLDLVQEWTKFSDEGIQAFLQYWVEEGADKSLPAAPGANAVEVVTIHKAKGLAYDIVLMPFCNWKVEPGSNLKVTLWADMRQTHFPQMPMLPVHYKKDLAQSQLAPFYFAEYVNSHMDNLNLLYVALTRARSRIVMWASLPRAKDGKWKYAGLKTINDMLYAAAVYQRGDDPGGTEIPDPIQEGGTEWNFGMAATKREASKDVEKFSINYMFEPWRIRHQTVLRKGDISGEAQPGQLARKRGILLHEIFSKLTRPDRLDKVLKEMEAAGRFASEDVKGLKQMVEGLLGLAP
ncbi:MAG TPA: UvrD-helicase domain-containing protein, partial [Phnomibacter sp.]|nr:UvrD-helicase domain-containing protein [Phnomibacter sp.]